MRRYNTKDVIEEVMYEFLKRYFYVPDNRFGNAYPQLLNIHGIEKLYQLGTPLSRLGLTIFHKIYKAKTRETIFVIYIRGFNKTFVFNLSGPTYNLKD